MSRPRVLYLTPRYPYPPNRGDRLHAFHMIRVFARRFDVTVASFADANRSHVEGDEVFRGLGVRTETVPLSSMGRILRLAVGMAGSRPLQLAYYDDPRMHERLRSLTQSKTPAYDALVCHLIRTVPLSKLVPSRVRVISLCDSIALGLRRRMPHAPLFERPSVWLEAQRVGRFESGVMEMFDEGWVVSEIDRAAFSGAVERIQVIPNGVEESLLEGEIRPDPPPVLGFIGHLAVPHNVDAAVRLVREILPRVQAAGLPARVRLVGPDPAPAVRALARLPGVELSGYAKDLPSAFRELRVLCAPLRFSAGVQNKLIESAAAGVPAVSSRPAVAALGPGAEEWVRGAETPDEYARAVVDVWERTTERMQILAGAREWVRETFRWENYADRLEQLLAERS